jgi:hypothetical protein
LRSMPQTSDKEKLIVLELRRQIMPLIELKLR